MILFGTLVAVPILLGLFVWYAEKDEGLQMTHERCRTLLVEDREQRHRLGGL